MKRDSAHLIPVAPARDSRSAPEQTASAALDAVSEPLFEPLTEWLYRAPRWLPTAHAQTIVPALFAQRPAVKYRRERWTTPDGDFIDLDWVSYTPGYRTPALTGTGLCFASFRPGASA